MEPLSPIKGLGAEATTAPTSKASISQTELAQDFDTFLNLLTTQLQNQDPLNPMDPTEFVSQLTQFSQLEQDVAQSASLEEISGLQKAAATNAGLAFLGQTVEARAGGLNYTGAPLSFDYETLAPGEDMAVRIFDQSDNLVAVLEANGVVGRHNAVWNGSLLTGEAAPPGFYRAELTATENNQSRSAGDIIMTGAVREMRLTGAGAIAILDSGAQINADQIEIVRSEPVTN